MHCDGQFAWLKRRWRLVTWNLKQIGSCLQGRECDEDGYHHTIDGPFVVVGMLKVRVVHST